MNSENEWAKKLIEELDKHNQRAKCMQENGAEILVDEIKIKRIVYK